MFREMRRKLQALDKEECERVLREGKTGVLALSGDGGYPYPVPLNYVYDGEYIYFHCAKTGHKIDSVNRCDKAGFCVVDKDEVMPEKFTTAYKSVIAFGRISLVKEEEEMRRATYLLSKKYSPEESDENISREIAAFFPALAVMKMKIEHVTGKRNK